FVPIAFVSVPVTLVAGWLVDVISPLVLAAVMSVAQLVMYVTVAHIDVPALAVVAIVAWGVSQGCFGPLTAAAIPRFFGRRYLGAIAGVQMSALVIASAIGPALFATIESIAGTYEVALWVAATVPATGVALAVLSARRPAASVSAD
ncbi:MAG: MFS transporter, partial [Acidimicrobiia bacterium]|nr:MFS transporter [Acidimicrobiia bacterium]